MRVTKTIREFIEAEVTKVYEPKVNNVEKSTTIKSLSVTKN